MELTNKNLSVPRQFFHTHFASWVNSLVVGEVIDVAVARPSYTWTRGIISSITRNDNGIQSIRVTYSESQSLPDGLSVSEEKELVIDEFNDLGWFASDRYQPEGKVCIYVFIPNSSKQVYNYEGMDPDKMISLAQLHSIKDTWTDTDAGGRPRKTSDCCQRKAADHQEA